MPTFRPGLRPHQSVMRSGSVLASWKPCVRDSGIFSPGISGNTGQPARAYDWAARSEEHTSELQSRRELVCRLLLEKKKRTHSELQRADIKAKREHRDTHTHPK